MKFFVISDNIDTYTGMRLAGIQGVVVHTPEEIRDALNGAIADSNIGIILITEILVKKASDLINDIKLNRQYPLITIIPDRHGAGRASNSIASYVKNVIGVNLK